MSSFFPYSFIVVTLIDSFYENIIKYKKKKLKIKGLKTKGQLHLPFGNHP